MATPTSADLELRALVKECQRHPDLRHYNYGKLWRQCREGIKVAPGVRLRIAHKRRGGKLFSSIDSLRDFQNALEEADRQHFEIKYTNPKDVRRRIDSAHSESVALLGPVRHR
jgi:hypothetical protein